MRLQTLSALMGLYTANCLFMLLATALIIRGFRQLDAGWQEGIPKLAPRPLAYAEVLCGVIAVIDVLAAIVAIGTTSIATPFLLALTVFWLACQRHIDRTVESARIVDTARKRKTYGGVI